jgi:hypothetical protein
LAATRHPPLERAQHARLRFNQFTIAFDDRCKPFHRGLHAVRKWRSAVHLSDDADVCFEQSGHHGSGGTE